MEWFYVSDGRQQGPVSADILESLAKSGTVSPDTLVWRDGLREWQPYSQIFRNSTLTVDPVPQHFCSQCGRPYSDMDLIHYGDEWICGSCKDVFFQRVRQGDLSVAKHRFAGFWIRFLAILIDGLILGCIGIVVNLFWSGSLLAPAVGRRPVTPGFESGRFVEVFALSMFVNLLLGAAYQAYFLSTRGATVGKLALGLRVITANGGPISPGRAIARYLCYHLDNFTLCIGYIIAGFDSEKRALHDHICGTRVIHNDVPMPSVR